MSSTFFGIRSKAINPFSGSAYPAYPQGALSLGPVPPISWSSPDQSREHARNAVPLEAASVTSIIVLSLVSGSSLVMSAFPS